MVVVEKGVSDDDNLAVGRNDLVVVDGWILAFSFSIAKVLELPLYISYGSRHTGTSYME